MIEYIKSSNVLPETQSSVRNGYSINSSLLNIINEIISNLNNSRIPIIIQIDFSNALDRVVHNLFLTKLKYNIRI